MYGPRADSGQQNAKRFTRRGVACDHVAFCLAEPEPSPSPSPSPVALPPGTWQSAASMSTPRTDFAAVRLESGRVLLIGGQTTPTADTAAVDLFDPAVDSI